MKNHLLFLGSALASSLSFLHAAGEAEMFQPKKATEGEATIVPFGKFLGEVPYSPTFGLSLWQSQGSELLEVTYKSPQEEEGWEKVDLANLKGIRDYSKLGFNKQLRFKNDEGSAILFRLREKFEMLNEDTGPAQFGYSRDMDRHSETSFFKGALMLDFYQDYLYNDIWKKKIWWIENPYRFWVRTGVEWDYQDVDPDNASDVLRQHLLLTFQANPDQDARLFRNKYLRIDSPQIVQVGLVHEDNRIADEDSWRWVVGWEPRLLINTGLLGQDFGRGFGLNQRMYYKKDSFGTLAASVVGKEDTTDKSGGEKSLDKYLENRSAIFSFINPYVGVEGSADSRVTLPALVTDPSFDSLRKLQDEVLRYDLSVGIGMDINKRLLPAEVSEDIIGSLTLAYKLHGIQPLDNFDDGHVWHEIRADFTFKQQFAGGKNPNDWAGLSAYVSYMQGEPPPTHESVDLLTAGVSVRF